MMMDIYGYLKKDHKKVALIFKEIIASSSQKKREALFAKAQAELLLHAETEQKTFYKALLDSEITHDEVKHGEKEHQEMKKMMAKLIKIPSKESVKWLVQFGEIKRIVDHHVKEEETELFPLAKKVLGADEAKELAFKMDQLKLRKRKKS